MPRGDRQENQNESPHITDSSHSSFEYQEQRQQVHSDREFTTHMDERCNPVKKISRLSFSSSIMDQEESEACQHIEEESDHLFEKQSVRTLRVEFIKDKTSDQISVAEFFTLQNDTPFLKQDPVQVNTARNTINKENAIQLMQTDRSNNDGIQQNYMIDNQQDSKIIQNYTKPEQLRPSSELHVIKHQTQNFKDIQKKQLETLKRKLSSPKSSTGKPFGFQSKNQGQSEGRGLRIGFRSSINSNLQQNNRLPTDLPTNKGNPKKNLLYQSQRTQKAPIPVKKISLSNNQEIMKARQEKLKQAQRQVIMQKEKKKDSIQNLDKVQQAQSLFNTSFEKIGEVKLSPFKAQKGSVCQRSGGENQFNFNGLQAEMSKECNSANTTQFITQQLMQASIVPSDKSSFQYTMQYFKPTHQFTNGGSENNTIDNGLNPATMMSKTMGYQQDRLQKKDHDNNQQFSEKLNKQLLGKSQVHQNNINNYEQNEDDDDNSSFAKLESQLNDQQNFDTLFDSKHDQSMMKPGDNQKMFQYSPNKILHTPLSNKSPCNTMNSTVANTQNTQALIVVQFSSQNLAKDYNDSSNKNIHNQESRCIQESQH